MFKEAREKVDNALHEKGYETRDELRQAIRDKISDSEELKKFDRVKSECVNILLTYWDMLTGCCVLGY